MSKPAKQKYRTKNWPAYTKTLRARGSLTMKVLFGLALRQAQGFVQSVLELSGLDWQAPDYSTMSRREKRLTVEIKARPSRGGRHLLVDSTGIKMLGEGEWKTRKHGAEHRRQWCKVHLGRRCATRRCERRTGWAGRSGRSGAAITGARWWRRRGAASSCWTSG